MVGFGDSCAQWQIASMAKRAAIGLSYPQSAIRALVQVCAADRRTPIDDVLKRVQSQAAHKNWKADPYTRKATASPNRHYLDLSERQQRIAFIAASAWEKAGRTIPRGYMVVFIDGNEQNAQLSNLYCLHRSRLFQWLRSVRSPIEAWALSLEMEIMAIETSEELKRVLLGFITSLADPDKEPDYRRQRAICETAQTLVGLLKIEHAYIRAIEGDGRIPFLEAAREAAVERREEHRKNNPLLKGPAAEHPWRGLGDRRTW